MSQKLSIIKSDPKEKDVFISGVDHIEVGDKDVTYYRKGAADAEGNKADVPVVLTFGKTDIVEIDGEQVRPY